jgi:hypothetical protein
MLIAFAQERFNIVQHMMWDGASLFAVKSQEPPNLVASHDKQRVLRTYSYPDLHYVLAEAMMVHIMLDAW